MTTESTPPIHLTPAQALAIVRPELATSTARRIAGRTSIVRCAQIALAALPELRSLRGELVALVGEDRAALVDRLELHALAALGAMAAWMAAPPDEGLQDAVKDLQVVRARLMTEARVLVQRGHVPRGALVAITSRTSHYDVARDALLLVALLERAAASRPLFTVGPSDLSLAQTLADQVMRRSGEGRRQQAEAEVRDEVFALLVQTYDQVRRLVSYLRWNEGDADQIVPSFWAQARKPAAARKVTRPERKDATEADSTR